MIFMFIKGTSWNEIKLSQWCGIKFILLKYVFFLEWLDFGWNVNLIKHSMYYIN